MKRKGAPIGVLALGLLGLALTSPATGQEAAMAPAGDWALFADEESCTLQRNFTVQSDGDTALFLRSWGPSAPNRLSLSGPTMLRDDRAAIVAAISFDDEEPEEVTAIASAYQGQPMVYLQTAAHQAVPQPGYRAFGFVINAPRGLATAARFSAETYRISIKLPDRPVQRLVVGDMEQPLAMLAQCEQTLVERWQLEVTPATGLSRPAMLLDPVRVAQNFHRPDVMTVNHTSWIANVRLVVDADGSVADCVLQSPRFSRKSTRTTCRRLERIARFDPALDKDGNAVAALYNASFMFARFP